MSLSDFDDESDALCDRFDRRLGLYYVMARWHGGQQSQEYRLLCRCGIENPPDVLDHEEDSQARHYAARYLAAVRERIKSRRNKQ